MDEIHAAGESTLSIAARVEEVRRASRWLCDSCIAFGVPEEDAERLEICLNEALANTLVHGTDAARAADVKLRLHVIGDARAGSACVEIEDVGVPFDPVAFSPRALARSLGEVQIGGLGLKMIRHNADILNYRRDRTCNILKLGVVWPRPDDD